MRELDRLLLLIPRIGRAAIVVASLGMLSPPRLGEERPGPARPPPTRSQLAIAFVLIVLLDNLYFVLGLFVLGALAFLLYVLAMLAGAWILHGSI
jgi:hypothetical protein